MNEPLLKPTKPKIYVDGHRLVMSWERKGRPDLHRIYHDRRCGVVWPGPNNVGYYCVMGLFDEHRVDGRVTHALLAEGNVKDTEALFAKIALVCKRLRCEWVLADLSKKYDTIYSAFGRWVRKRGITYVRTYDAADFGGIEEAMPAINDLVGGADDPLERSALRIPVKSILGRQLDELRPDDLHLIDKTHVEERFYAAHAMSYVVTSWQLYPFRKPGDKTDEDPGRGKGYG